MKQSSEAKDRDLKSLEEEIFDDAYSIELIKSYWMTRYVEEKGVDIYDELASEFVEKEAESIWDSLDETKSIAKLMQSSDPLIIEAVKWWKP